MFNNHIPKRLLAAVGGIGVIIGCATGVVDAAPKPRLDFSATGTWSTPESWRVVLDGHAIGVPFDGTLTGIAHAQDRTLPTAGSCEPGGAFLRVADDDSDELRLRSAGEVCHVVTPFGDEWVYSGPFDVTTTTRHKVRRSTGILGIRLWADGTISVRAVETNRA